MLPAVARDLEAHYRKGTGEPSLFGEDQGVPVEGITPEKLLGKQLTAQVKSGQAARPAKLKQAQPRDLFDEEGPDQGGLFSRRLPDRQAETESLLAEHDALKNHEGRGPAPSEAATRNYHASATATTNYRSSIKPSSAPHNATHRAT